jgi:hypothetical protein
MTPEEARATVDSIRIIGRGDPEAAHSMEDNLYHRFVRSVATILDDNKIEITWFDVAEVIALAEIILETEDIEFPRWRA